MKTLYMHSARLRGFVIVVSVLCSLDIALAGNQEAVPKAPIVLSGKLTDESGQPVTEAKLTLFGLGRNLVAQTNDQGEYEFRPSMKDGKPHFQDGKYYLLIESSEWVSKLHSKNPRINLSLARSTKKDFTLPRAAQVQFRVVDEKGGPVRDVFIETKSLADDYTGMGRTPTNETGWAIVGGLKPQRVKYLFGFRHEDYAFARVSKRLDEPKLGEIETVTLVKGVSVSGKALCSDGKPAAGWRLSALPSWWTFGVVPRGVMIEDDGSFELKHILPGEYKLSVSIPIGNGSSQSLNVLTADLTKAMQPLAIKIDRPSRGSMSSISGIVKFVGKQPEGVRLNAYSSDGKYSGYFLLPKGQTRFEIDSIPKGTYTVSVRDKSLEPFQLEDVKAPTENLTITLKERVQPVVTGTILLPDGKPLTAPVRIRVVQLRSLESRRSSQDTRWQDVQTSDGTFSLAVTSKGVYTVTAIARGFAATNSEPFNTVEDADNPIKIVLSEGVSLSGIVVNEQNEPIPGAVVQPVSLGMPATNRRRDNSDFGSIKTDADGRFEFPNLASAPERFKISKENYCPTVTEPYDLKAHDPTFPLKLTLTVGGTIRGLVYEAAGKRAAGKRMRFENRTNGRYFDERFISTATDNNGFYQAQHLPDQLVQITCGDESRDSGVVRQTVLPRNGKTLTVMFGGTQELTGILKLNGKPLSETPVLLGEGTNSSADCMRALARTDSTGRFTFYGPPPGIWTLSYEAAKGRRSSWQTMTKVEVGTEPADLGEVDLCTGSLTVTCSPEDPSRVGKIRCYLRTYARDSQSGRPIGTQRPWVKPTDPFVFDNVTTGDLEVVCYQNEYPAIRHRITVRPDSMNQTIDVPIPSGSASVSGVMNQATRKAMPGLMILTSIDERLQVYATVDEAGKFSCKNLPAGKWQLHHGSPASLPIHSMELGEGEAATLSLDKVPVPQSQLGHASIRVFTPKGALTSSHVKVTGPNGPIPLRPMRRGEITLSAAAGDYKITASLKGFESVTRSITLKPAKTHAPAASPQKINLRLGETKKSNR